MFELQMKDFKLTKNQQTATYANWAEEAWKKFKENGTPTNNLCGTGAVLLQLSYYVN